MILGTSEPAPNLRSTAAKLAYWLPCAAISHFVDLFYLRELVRPGGLMIVRAGGNAGMFSGIIGGWSAGGPRGSIPVTKEVRP